VEDVDNVVVVLQSLDEVVDILLLLGRQLAHGEGDALKLERLDFVAFVFKIFRYRPIVLEVSVNHYLVFIAEHLVDVVVYQLKLQLVHVDVVALGHHEAALPFEEEVVHSHGAQLALAAHEGGTEVRHCALII